jgi:predicted PurR-regulated permease PerM
LIIIRMVLLDLWISFYFVYSNRSQKQSSSQNFDQNSQKKRDEILSEGIQNYFFSMVLAGLLMMLGHIFVLALFSCRCCLWSRRRGPRSIFSCE